MIEVLSLDNMKKSDAKQCLITGSKELMLRAGNAIYNSVSWNGKILIVCGSGNNAGDGYVVAKCLLDNNYDVTLLRVFDRFSEDGRYYYDMLAGINEISMDSDINCYDMIVDCLLGTGFSGKLKDSYRNIIEKINNTNAYVISADINSGLNGDTGMAELAVKSDITFAIGSYKCGHFLNMAKDYIKEKKVLDIGIEVIDKPYQLLEINDLKPLFKERVNYSNKGDYGYIALVGGSLRYSGAIRLANMANSAMRSGAGVVFLASIKSLASVILPNILESTFYPLSETEDGFVKYNENELKGLLKCKAIAFGMGIGNTNDTALSLKYLLDNYDKTLIIDADGLNALSNMLGSLRTTKAKVILTPHIKEFSRLTGKSIDDILLNPVDNAISFARDNNVILLLKGPSTIITDGNDVYLTNKGTSGMATAGSGDVLSGIIAAVCAPNNDKLLLATAGAAFINGRAGELAASLNSNTTMIASDTANNVKNVIIEIENA